MSGTILLSDSTNKVKELIAKIILCLLACLKFLSEPFSEQGTNFPAQGLSRGFNFEFWMGILWGCCWLTLTNGSKSNLWQQKPTTHTTDHWNIELLPKVICDHPQRTTQKPPPSDLTSVRHSGFSLSHFNMCTYQWDNTEVISIMNAAQNTNIFRLER